MQECRDSNYIAQYWQYTVPLCSSAVLIPVQCQALHNEPIWQDNVTSIMVPALHNCNICICISAKPVHITGKGTAFPLYCFASFMFVIMIGKKFTDMNICSTKRDLTLLPMTCKLSTMSSLCWRTICPFCTMGHKSHDSCFQKIHGNRGHDFCGPLYAVKDHVTPTIEDWRQSIFKYVYKGRHYLILKEKKAQQMYDHL